mgnify:CR=1 FL=1
MQLFIDCEFNSMGGGLISMALVSEDGEREFYEVVECSEAIDPWVKENVMPILEKDPIPLVEFQDRLKKFLGQFPAVHVTADYPDDIKHFCNAVITGAGEWFEVQPLTMEVDEECSAKASAVPHNALHDARAIRKSWLAANGIAE